MESGRQIENGEDEELESGKQNNDFDSSNEICMLQNEIARLQAVL